MRKFLVLFMLTLPAVAMAQTTTFELTPTIGYRWGGEFRATDNDLFDEDVDVKSSAAFGLNLNMAFNRWLELELLIDHQSSEFGDSTLWADNDIDTDVDITYYHVGLLFQWHAGQVRPYIVGSIGMADISPDVPGLSSENRFSASLGGGVKFDFSPHVGFRLELRGFWADTGSSGWWDDSWDDDWDDDDWWDDCNNDCWGGTPDLVQGDIRVGVIFKF